MDSPWRTVRVLISSTFRDMHAERDHLVKVVFPALRERLEPHRVHLDDIDLRWGVTGEQAENDQVLDLCLRQIEECRPFFIGILGERYGWVPRRLTGESVSRHGWLEREAGKSITELEVIYGAFQPDSTAQTRAFFYFRDPACLATIPDARRGTYEETSTDEERAELATIGAEACVDDRRRRLRDLKARIRRSGYPLMDGYHARWDPLAYDRPTNSRGRLIGLEAFGDRLRDQLWEAIRVELALPETPSVDAGDDFLSREQALHELFMESRLRVHIGRETVQRGLLAFAEGDSPSPCLVVGEAGSGKSAALARFVMDYRARHPEVLVIPHFVGASRRSTELRSLLKRLCLELKARFGFEEDLPEQSTALIRTFRDFLFREPRAPLTGRNGGWFSRALRGRETTPPTPRTPILIVIDALDQLDEAEDALQLTWLAADFHRM